LTIRRVIDQIRKCHWVPDTHLTDQSQRRWVFKRDRKPNRITIIGDLDDVLTPHEAGGIITSACDD